MLYQYGKQHPRRGCCSFKAIALVGVISIVVFYTAWLTDLTSSGTKEDLWLSKPLSVSSPVGDDDARHRDNKLAWAEQVATLEDEKAAMEEEWAKGEADSLLPKNAPVQPLPASALWQPNSPGTSILRRRESLAEWVNSAATIQEIETLTNLKNWVQGQKAQNIAEALVKLSSGTGWSECAKEHAICACGTSVIRYGHDTRWVNWQKPEGVPEKETYSVICDNENFGGQDPAPYLLKECQCYGRMVPVEGAVGSPAGIKTQGKYCGDLCSQGKSKFYRGPPRSRSSVCARPHTHERLWSCDTTSSRVPDASSPHALAQSVLDEAVTEFCRDTRLAGYFDVYLDCDFAENFFAWTSSESEWIDEALVTYIAGKPNSPHEWMANNLIRSAMMFSSRPIVVVVFDHEFKTPHWWQDFANVIVYRMMPGMSFPVSFNFNKIRAMIASRVIIGIELDVDQIVAPGIDRVFAATRQESTASYPFPIMPVHWMSRDAQKGEQFYEYGLHSWKHEHGMRWCHAHPSWSFWSLLFLADILLKRYLVALAKPKMMVSGRLWSLSTLAGIDAKSLVAKGNQARKVKKFQFEGYFMEDEDMLNVELWLANATKAWCKFDLEPELFIYRHWLARRLYSDPRWYPDGVPLMFLSAHNTKDFEKTDVLLSLLAQCSIPGVVNRSKCSWSKNDLPPSCRLGSLEERQARSQDPAAYISSMCCCLQPRQDHHIYWGGQWYSRKEDVPQKSPLPTKGPRRCLLI
eukprot:TRINITY_DN20051_c0_g2_i1.p1 TRINITY_DN20051_c0_g2~~TRINITY_DN20051_c0_g2_i1.p1  ORF type:complete len:746 (-),score=105.77 TRINITY_DN20051_c0_g2_i1:38-2275(-)